MQSLAAMDVYKKVYLIGRRNTELPTGPGYEKMVRGSLRVVCGCGVVMVSRCPSYPPSVFLTLSHLCH